MEWLLELNSSCWCWFPLAGIDVLVNFFAVVHYVLWIVDWRLRKIEEKIETSKCNTIETFWVHQVQRGFPTGEKRHKEKSESSRKSIEESVFIQKKQKCFYNLIKPKIIFFDQFYDF